MKSSTQLLAGALLLVAGVSVGMLVTSGRAADADASKGAVVIDAAKYPDLQAAFDAVPEAGGLVKLPPGEFAITKPLVLERENTRVEGAGAATHIINKNEDGAPALIIRPKNIASDKKARVWRVQVADFRISGNPKSGDGLYAEYAEELYVHGLAVDHNGGNGINTFNCYEDPRICDSIITYNAEAGLNIVGDHDIVVNGNHFEENQDAVRCVDAFNLCMNGNNIDDHLGNGVVIENTYGSVVSGNMIEECKGIGIILDRDCYGITLSANVIAHDFGGGIDLRDAWGCAVSANTFVLDGVQALTIGPKSGRLAVTGNTFANSYIGAGQKRLKTDQDNARGILLNGTKDVTITGNSFAGLYDQAIRAEGTCERIVVVANVLVDNARASEGKLAPIDLANASGAIVENNSIAK